MIHLLLEKSVFRNVYIVTALLVVFSMTGCDVPVSVGGTVTDIHSSHLRDVSITLVPESGGKPRTTSTNLMGEYLIIRTGTSRYYNLIAEKDGFKTLEKRFETQGVTEVKIDFILQSNQELEKD